MKNSRTLLSLILITLLILSSCLLQKRHYMQGYTISWKSSRHKVKTVESPALAKSLIIKKAPVETGITIIEPSENSEIILASNENTIQLPTKKPKLIRGQDLSNSNLVEPTVVASFKNNTKQPDEPKKKAHMGILPGILFMLLGLLLAGLGYVFYTNLGVFFGTFFFLIFGLGGAIFFIIGLVALIVGLVAK